MQTRPKFRGLMPTDIIINRHGDLFLKLTGCSSPAGCSLPSRLAPTMTAPGGDGTSGNPKPFPHNNLTEQRKAFADAGFEIVYADEAYGRIRFTMWAPSFGLPVLSSGVPGFSVDRCFDRYWRSKGH